MIILDVDRLADLGVFKPKWDINILINSCMYLLAGLCLD